MNGIKKEEALERLRTIECEVKQLKQVIHECDEKKNITERVKSFEDACCITGFIPTFSKWDTKDEIAFKKLKVIARALNEGWVPNWKNENEYKYAPYFRMLPFGFDDSYYDIWSTYSYVGSRLCYKTKELAEYAGKQFEPLYKDLLT